MRTEVMREREVGGSYQEPVVSNYATRQEVAPQPITDDTELEEPLDPRVERARRLRPAWTSEQQDPLARALRHTLKDGAVVAMAP